MKFKLISLKKLVENLAVKFIPIKNSDLALKVLYVFNNLSRLCLSDSKFILIKSELLCNLNECLYRKRIMLH